MRKIMAQHKKVHIVTMNEPNTPPFHLKMKTLYSAISPGTELNLVRRSQEKEVHLGYSAVGIVIECGAGVKGYQEGDMVACYGHPYVKHADILSVPSTLCAKVPAQVEPKEAALGGIGAIAIHGLRQAQLQFGESVVVAGLGVLGHLIAQVADAAGNQVIGYDIDDERMDLLRQRSRLKTVTDEDDLESWIQATTAHEGVDAVILCAGGKDSLLPTQSLQWVRNQGKVVLVGLVEPNFPRDLLFAKEADIRVSRAGGPGRYDPIYEKQAIDYPYGYVRWTEGRNVAEFLRLIAENRINVAGITSETVAFDASPEAYEHLNEPNNHHLTKIIEYRKN